MFNFVMFSAAFVFSLSICRFSFVTSGLNNCFDSFDFTFAQSTVVVPFGTDKAPYFDEDSFMDTVCFYFEHRIHRYLTPFDKYSFDFIFGDNPNLPSEKTEKGKAYTAGFVFGCNYLGYASLSRSKKFVIEKGVTYES